LCPYAIFTKDKEEGDTPHYKEQPHTTSGTPEKKPEFKDEDKNEVVDFYEYVKQRDLMEAKKRKKMLGFLNATADMP